MITQTQEQLSKRHRTRQEIMEMAINGRLNKSLQTYDKELSLGVEYITQKSEINVLKKL
jgi:hypothetical protein